ncbi:DUF4760 domain-containing protein [Micromonospora chalcea]
MYSDKYAALLAFDQGNSLASVTGLADLAQAISVPLLVWSIWYAGRQLSELRSQVVEGTKVRRLEATSRYIEYVGSDEIRAARRWILSLPEDAWTTDPVTDTERGRALRLAVAYDRVGIMLAHDLLDFELVRDWQGREIRQLWRRLEPVVVSERLIPGRSEYCRYLERMAERL